jgi:dolichol-phosphate mannosyltransferase
MSFSSTDEKARLLISVIIPVYNEEQTIKEFITRIQNVWKRMLCDYELIFVDDGSKDRTREILKREKSTDQNIKIISFTRNFGHQVAISAGLDHCRGDAVVVIDADLQDPPELIPDLISEWKKGNDIVHARRRKRAGESSFKRWSAAGFYRLLKLISETEIPADVGDFRLLSKRAVNDFKQLRERHRYVRGLVAWLGYSQGFVEYDRDQRYSGETKYSLWKMLRFSIDGISSFSVLPLRMASICGITCALSGAIYTIYALYIKLVKHEAVVGWTSIIIAVLFVGGIQLLCLGIIGEYIGILYDEIKNRPLYLISEIC